MASRSTKLHGERREDTNNGDKLESVEDQYPESDDSYDPRHRRRGHSHNDFEESDSDGVVSDISSGDDDADVADSARLLYHMPLYHPALTGDDASKVADRLHLILVLVFLNLVFVLALLLSRSPSVPGHVLPPYAVQH